MTITLPRIDILIRKARRLSGEEDYNETDYGIPTSFFVEALNDASDLIHLHFVNAKCDPFAAYDATAGTLAACFAGQVEGIGAAPHLIAEDAAGSRLADRRWAGGGAPGTHVAALGEIIAWPDGVLRGRQVVWLGHRVVPGGPEHTAPGLLDAAGG